MSSTNKTTYYELPQFVDSDLFNPLVDDNDAYAKIDTALHQIADAEAGDASEIVGVKGRVTTVEGKIEALETQNGSEVLSTTAQTLSGAVNELDNDVSGLDDRLDIVENDIDSPTGIKAKIGAIENAVTNLYNGNVNDNSIAYSKLNQLAKDILNKNNQVIFVKNSDLNPSQSVGACTVIITKETHKVIMIDSNRDTNYSNVVDTLVENGITHIDYFILTHFHNDHYMNIPSLVSDGYIDETTVGYIPRANSYVTGWDTKRLEVLSYFTLVETPTHLVPLEVENFKFTFVNCDSSDYDYYYSIGNTTHNVYSMGIYVECENTTVFVTGDMYPVSFEHLATIGQLHYAQILVAPHHGMSYDYTEAYLAVRPEYVIAQISPAPEVDHDNVMDGHRAYPNSVDTALSNALGIPFYITGYGDVYVSIGYNDYCVIPSGKPVYSVVHGTMEVYVDDTYSGIALGTKEKPFTHLMQAVALALNFQSNMPINVNIVGTYLHSDEILDINGVSTAFNIIGSKTESDYNVKLLRTTITNSSYVTITDVEFVDTLASTTVRIERSIVDLTNCKIVGDTTSEETSYSRSAITLYKASSVTCLTCEISNRNCLAYIQYNSNVFLVNCTGTNNNNLFTSYGGGIAQSTGSKPEYTGRFLIERSDRGMVAAVSPTESYSEGLAFRLFRDTVTELTTKTFNLNVPQFTNRMFIIYGDNGGVYKLYRKGANDYVGVDTIVAPMHSADDPDFSATVSGNNLIVTYSSYVVIECI